MCNSNKRQMHARNVFNKPPDYTELAIKYPEFRKVCKLELTGKVCINYKNESALRALTQMLLLEYFQLKVEFAPGSLVPTLPLRLNYILWLEDLMGYPECDNIKGIDIGCGSSCIYSLLAAKKNNWQMVALESNLTNLEYAQQNIDRNIIKENISLFPQSSKTQIFQEYFDSEKKLTQFDFCLCNPPFYDSQTPEGSHTRNPAKRPPPHNCPTGYKDELSCQGGEVKFVEQIIAESFKFKQNISITGIPSGFLKKKVEDWEDDAEYQNSRQLVRCLRVVNDIAERGVALMDEYNKIHTNNEEQKQYLLLLIKEYKMKFPDSNKSTLLQ